MEPSSFYETSGDCFEIEHLLQHVQLNRTRSTLQHRILMTFHIGLWFLHHVDDSSVELVQMHILYLYIYIYIYVCVYIYIHTYIYTYMCVYMCVCVCFFSTLLFCGMMGATHGGSWFHPVCILIDLFQQRHTCDYRDTVAGK